ncbi:MAG: SUMF1/EgtB/PvdO family nonheme iron enzyme [Sedimentisphaerales bacterium]|nr:SUMF1/EgtB/PvdO family nonheme iron enzyme [Sedimentisphaerales bacterium]
MYYKIILIFITTLILPSIVWANQRQLNDDFEGHPGDINGDEYVNLHDLILLAESWLTDESIADIYPQPVGDGLIDLNDFAEIASYWRIGEGDMNLIPGGTFQMGDNFAEWQSDELPLHTVTISSFYIGRCEVTNQQYCEYLNSAIQLGQIVVTNGFVYKADSGTKYVYCDTNEYPDNQIAFSDGTFLLPLKSGRDMNRDPMSNVTWVGAAAYCNWRSEQEGKQPCYNLSTWECDFSKNGYHLPTEAQWEYAARGGLPGKRFPLGDTISHNQANYYSWGGIYYDIGPTRNYHPGWNDGIEPYTSPVCTFSPNGYGLYDMEGNDTEWCNDWYDKNYYKISPEINPTGPTNGDYRVIRGGCWAYNATMCRVAERGRGGLNWWLSSTGFRIALGFE